MARIPSIAEAQDLLRQAVQANKHELVRQLTEVRQLLEQLLAILGPDEIPREVHMELSRLVDLRGQFSRIQSTSSYVLVADKIAFIQDHLNKFGGQMPKSDLLRAAQQEWTGKTISPNFLDKAIEEAFETRKETDGTVTVMVKPSKK